MGTPGDAAVQMGSVAGEGDEIVDRASGRLETAPRCQPKRAILAGPDCVGRGRVSRLADLPMPLDRRGASAHNPSRAASRRGLFAWRRTAPRGGAARVAVRLRFGRQAAGLACGGGQTRLTITKTSRRDIAYADTDSPRADGETSCSWNPTVTPFQAAGLRCSPASRFL